MAGRINFVSKTAPEPVEPGNDETEMEHFEKAVKGLLSLCECIPQPVRDGLAVRGLLDQGENEDLADAG